MLGKAILVSPVLDQGVTSVNAYFPQQLWYNFADRSLAVDASNGGVWKTLSAPLTTVNVHIAGGNILPLQQSALTTTVGRTTPFTLVTALCPKGKAWGSLFWDDGEQVSLNSYLSVNYAAEVTGSSGSFTSTVEKNTYSAASSLLVQEVVVLGKDLVKPSAVSLNGVDLDVATQVSYDSVKKSITFSKLNLKLNTPINLQWK
jgi:alpha-glucosidase